MMKRRHWQLKIKLYKKVLDRWEVQNILRAHGFFIKLSRRYWYRDCHSYADAEAYSQLLEGAIDIGLLHPRGISKPYFKPEILPPTD